MKKIGQKLSYNAKDFIGQGGNGTIVFSGLFEGVKPVAIKRIQHDDINRSLIDKEAKIMLTVSDHPNILRYFFYETDENF